MQQINALFDYKEGELHTELVYVIIEHLSFHINIIFLIYI